MIRAYIEQEAHVVEAERQNDVSENKFGGNWEIKHPNQPG